MTAARHIDGECSANRIKQKTDHPKTPDPPTQFVEELKMVCYTDPLANKPIDSVEAYIAARHAVVGFGKPGQSLVDEVLAQHNINRNVVLCAPSFFTLAKMMEGTDLVVTMPDYLSRTVFPSFSKHEPPIPFADVQVDLIWHRRSEQSGRNMWIRENVMASAADLQQRLKSERSDRVPGRGVTVLDFGGFG